MLGRPRVSFSVECVCPPPTTTAALGGPISSIHPTGSIKGGSEQLQGSRNMAVEHSVQL